MSGLIRIHIPLTLTLLALLIGVLVPAAHHPEEPIITSGQVHAAESTQHSDRRSAADRGRIQGRMHQAAYEYTWRADAADAANSLTVDSLIATTEITKVTASDGLKQDFAGSSVAVSGDTLVVGAPQEACYSSSACLPGAVYIFYRNQNLGWTEVQKITPFDGTADDQFGQSVTIDGDTLVVGAPGAEVGGSSNQGAVYVYNRTPGGPDAWGVVTKLVETGSEFMNGLAILWRSIGTRSWSERLGPAQPTSTSVTRAGRMPGVW